MSKKLPRGLTQRGGRYRVQFASRSRPGKMYRERLSEGTTKRQAETYLNKLREEDRLGLLQWPKEKTAPSEKPPEMPSVGLYATETYLPDMKLRNAPTTVARKAHALTYGADWFWDVSLDQVDIPLIQRYQRERKDQGVRSRTVNLEWGVVRHLLMHAHKSGVLPYPPPQIDAIPERDSRAPRWLSVEEATRALEYAHARSHMWYTLTLFLLSTGARWGETRQLRWDDLDLDGELVHLRAETAKQRRARDVPLLPELVEALRALEPLGEMVFSRRHRHTQEVISLRKEPKCFGGNSFPWSQGEDLKVGPHVFRHTFANWRLRAGVGMEKVQAWLGHSSIQMTVDIYGHIKPEDFHEEIQRAPRPQIARLRVI